MLGVWKGGVKTGESLSCQCKVQEFIHISLLHISHYVTHTIDKQTWKGPFRQHEDGYYLQPSYSSPCLPGSNPVTLPKSKFKHPKCELINLPHSDIYSILIGYQTPILLL
jgi:hypothetical protein